MKKFGIFVLSFCLIFGCIDFANAQVRVVKSAGGKTALDLSGFNAVSDAAGQEFLAVLKNDLVRSGWFSVVAGGQGEYRMLGSVQLRGSKLEVTCRIFGVASRQAVLSRSYREKKNLTRQLAHRVADDVVEALTGRKGIASTRIVMVGTRTKKKELYICDADGSNLHQLTSDNSVSVVPKWGPRAEKILYTAFLNRFPDIFQIDVRSGKRTCVAKFPGLNTGAEYSPDRKDIALILSKDGNPELYIKNIRSGRLTRLTRTPRVAEASPSWSPDGRQIVYVSDQSGRPQLYVISRDSGRPKRLTMRGRENVAPDWGPGNLIAFSSNIGGNYHVNVIDPSTREVKQVTADYADYENPSWAPDGRHIACTRTQNYRSKVYILDTLGDQPINLTNHSGDWYAPSWSPK